MPWWTKEPLRIVEIADALGGFKDLSIAKQVECIAGMGGNVQHFHCMDHAASANDTAGMGDRGFYFKTSLSKQDHPDRLKAYLPLAHKKGIRVLIYFNVHWYTRQFGKEHPDWRQVREDGTPIDNVYETGTSLCVNSPWREWVFQLCRDLGQYEIDGIIYDGPIFFANCCYCGTCKRLFRERTGKELPLKSSAQDPLWKDLVEFQADSIARFLADSNAVIKGINPELAFYMNGNANWPYWPTGRDNTRIIKHSDLLIAEGGFFYNDLNQDWVYKPGVTAKLLSSQSGGKPALSANVAGHKSWNWYLLPKTEISMMFAETLAAGGNYWTAIFTGNIGQPNLEVIQKYNNFIKKNPEPFIGTRSLAKVALVWPDHSCNYYEGSSVPLTDFTRKVEAKGVGDLGMEFYGYYEALVRAQVPFDVIGEDNLGDLARYDLVVLPNVPRVSDQAVAALKTFVKNGGTLVADFETSLYDPAGRHQKDFSLNDLLGITYAGEIFGPMHWDYVTPSGKRKLPVLDAITQQLIPAPTHGIKVKATTGKVLLAYCERLPGSYEGIPDISDVPFLVENRYGKGRTYYLAGTFGAGLGQFRFPEYVQLIRNLSYQSTPVQVTIENSPWVEVSLREKDGETYLHLINHTGGPKRPLTAQQTLIDLKIHLNIKAQQARALWANKKITLRPEGRKGVALSLPKLTDYEVIVIR